VAVKYKDFQFVRPGQHALVEVEEVLPGRRLLGTVLYDTHETNLQLNAVYVKVGLMEYPALLFPAPWAALGQALTHAGQRATLQELMGRHDRLRPEMIATVHFLAPPVEAKEPGGEILRILVPRQLLVASGDQSQLWIVDQAASRASLRPVVLGPGEKDKKHELVEIAQGLQPTDKVITSGMETLKPGQRIRIIGEGQ
jgi:hypothetical protein